MLQGAHDIVKTCNRKRLSTTGKQRPKMSAQDFADVLAIVQGNQRKHADADAAV
jgi:molybdenum cofactor biosynthesis enzyme MoaA